MIVSSDFIAIVKSVRKKKLHANFTKMTLTVERTSGTNEFCVKKNYSAI